MTKEQVAAATGQTDEQPTGASTDILNQLKLSEEQIENLKGNSEVLNILTQSIQSKREANAEAKANRLELEKIKLNLEEAEKKKLEKRGKFEELAAQYKGELEAERARNKTLTINNQVAFLASKNGIKKNEYLSMFDTSSLELDENNNVVGLDEKFESFKAEFSDLFELEKLAVDEPKPAGVITPSEDANLKALKEAAQSSPTPQNLAKYTRALKASKKG